MVQEVEVPKTYPTVRTKSIKNNQSNKETVHGTIIDVEYIDTRSKNKNVYTLFETFEDSSSEYKMKKIRLIEQDFLEFFEGIKETEVQIVAFYGDFTQCMNLAEMFIDLQVSRSINLEEGLVAIKNKQRIALVYKTNCEIFDYKCEVDSNNLAVTYLRYLLDTCHDIFAVQPLSQTFNVQKDNPYKEYMNPGQEIKEIIVEPDDKICVEEIQLSTDRTNQEDQIECYKGYLDFQKFLIKPSFKLTHNEFELKQQIWDSAKCKQQNLSYSELQEHIYREWPQTKHYFNDNFYQKQITRSLQSILNPFIKQNSYLQFWQKADQLGESYEKAYSDIQCEFNELIKNQKLDSSQIVIEFINSINCQNIKDLEAKKSKEDIQQDSYIKKSIQKIQNLVKPSEKCTYECKSLISLRSELNSCFNINWEFVMKSHLHTNIHKNKIQELKNFAKDKQEIVKEYIKEQEKAKEQKIISLRQNILKEFFGSIQEMIITKKVEVLNQYQISFSGINIIRNEKHQVTNWNLIESPVSLNGQFPKESTGNVTLKSLLFFNETTGIILFKNTPLEKCSIHYFNIQNKGNPVIKLVQNFSSLDKQIIIEPNFKQLLMFDNSQKQAHLMKISNTGTIEGEIQVLIYDFHIDGCDGLTIKSIKSACFLPYGDKFFILSEDSNLFEYRISSRNLYHITKRINQDNKIIKQKIRPESDDDEYQEIQVLADGKSIILISQYKIDIYDLNYDKMMSFTKSYDFQFIKCYNDKLNNFLIIFSISSTKCYQIKGLSAVKHYQSKITFQNKKSQHIGNPVFDYIYQSYKKFGPQSSFLGCPQDIQLTFIYHQQQLNKIDIKSYFKFLSLQDVTLVPKQLTFNNNLFDHVDSKLITKDLKMILLGRVAIHIATIENFTLVPLRNGANISDQIAQNFIQNRDQIQNFIQRIKELIKFGIYEKVFEDHKSPLIVISIVGKQSSGKSYVMNRLFGTRFNVAATRCTDGIWMSIVKTNQDGIDEVFVVLDCEGLFSARRNETEEMKLCLALSAVSDMMILNQDLSFSRYLNILFNNFSKCIGRIKGKQLFKGCLMMLIRDVKSDEAESAYNELQSNLLQLQQNEQDRFLSACFQGRLLSQCLNYYSLPIFNDEIAFIRENYFFNMNATRWNNGSDFADSLKIALAQIFSDDDSDIDIYLMKIKCENALVECLNMFYEGSEQFQCEEGILKLEVEIANQKYNLVFQQSQFKVNFLKQILQLEIPEQLLQIFQEFQNQTTQIQNNYFNSYRIAFNTFYEAFLDQRMKFVLEYFNKNFNAVDDFVDTIKSYQYQLTKEIEQTISKLKYCKRTCRDCKRICSKIQEHRNDCDCESGHICEDKCRSSPICEEGGYLCVEKFGHEGDHRCSIGNHKCTQQCEIESCKFICSENFGHSAFQNHNCGNKHPCQQKCEDEACERTCHHDSINVHEKHNCGSIKCVHKCIFCGDNCCSDNHLHDQAIKVNDLEGMVHDNHDGIEILMQHHLCSATHNCKKSCTEKGICNQTFQIEEKIWKNEFGEFTYNQIIPIAETIQCKIFIDKYNIEHQGNHDCKQPHRCPEQCPECRSFCNKDYGHDGLHSSKAHRNKENCVFVSTKDSATTKIVIEDDKKKREYKIGESCQPESCDRSCERKGRSHYHLKECKGVDTCEARLYPYVRHSRVKFEPFTDKNFDLWLCTNYWNSMNWEPPINGGALTLVQQCNYICGHSSHGDERSFCTKGSWHTDEHHFCCEHKIDTGVIDIVFCMDTTGSMSSYIENSKKTVTKLMNLFNIGGRSLKFGFVAYKDHPPQDPTYVTLCKDLTDQVSCQQFIDTLVADGGGDGPEAVLDGLYDSATKMTWRKDSMRFVFHIGDAPPHGKLYVTSGDGFPDGCPCKITIEMIAQRMEANKIRYRLLTISSYTNQMTAVFKNHIKDFEEVQIDSAQQLEIRMSEIIAREIQTDEIDFIQ